MGVLSTPGGGAARGAVQASTALAPTELGEQLGHKTGVSRRQVPLAFQVWEAPTPGVAEHSGRAGVGGDW